MPEYDWTDYVGGILCAVLAWLVSIIFLVAHWRATLSGDAW